MSSHGSKGSTALQRLADQDGNWRRPRSPALAIPGATPPPKDSRVNTISHPHLAPKHLNLSQSLGERGSGSSSSHYRKPPLSTPTGTAEQSSSPRNYRFKPSSTDERYNNSFGGQHSANQSHNKDASTADSWRSHHARINEPANSFAGGSLGSPHHQRRHIGFLAASNASEVARRAFIASEIGSIGSPAKSGSAGKGELGHGSLGSVAARSPLTSKYHSSQREQSPSNTGRAAGSLGPAVHLRPLRVAGFDASKEDETGGQREDWAETPTSSLPSLPGSPSWASPSSAKKPLRASQSALASMATANARSPLARAIFSGSPARNPLSLAATSVTLDEAGEGRRGGLSPTGTPLTAMAHRFQHSVESPKHTSETESELYSQLPDLSRKGPVRRESGNSLSSVGGHSLQHSRRDSASNFSSPSAASVTSSRQIYGGVYRPPHLRNHGSSNGLKPVVAHYDRIRTPSLRGSLRSPDPPQHRNPSRLTIEASSSSATTPLAGLYEGGITSSRVASPRPGFDSQRYGPTKERPSYFDSHQHRPRVETVFSNVLIEQDEEESEEEGGPHQDEEEGRLDKRPSMLYHLNEDNESLPALDDEFDMTHEEMLQHKTSLTESYRRSRARRLSHPSPMSSSYQIGNGRPVVDIFEVGDRLGPGMIHDGHTITIAETTDGFQSQQRDITGTRLEVKSKLGEGSYAVVYLVEEIAADDGQIHVGPQDEEGLIAGRRGGRAIAGSGSMDEHKVDDAAEGDATLADTTIPGTLLQDPQTGEVNYNNGELSSTLRAARGPRLSLARRVAEEEEEEQRREAAQTGASGDWSHSEALPGIDEPHEGRLFALKCLCKRDLSDEMLELQRLEATIHQSIPPHKNIITLYRTYETPEWLFLVLEYCPGQDLYYWLEQAHDVDGESEEVARAIVAAHQTSSTTAVEADQEGEDGDGTLSPDGTPPSPSLLASTSTEGLLSRKRLKLISKMFRQMCEAVQFCHDRGIAHRDLKPENLIVYDRRGELNEQREEEECESLLDEISRGHGTGGPRRPSPRRYSSASSSALSARRVSNSSLSSPSTSGANTSIVSKTPSTSGSSAVIVKLTDFGLATAEAECQDFSCGSRPYMSPECHLNLSETYDPFQADVWSLGIVLLNMIFHRSPFKEPNAERCSSFASYCYDPIEFLMKGFEGLSRECAEFFSSRVLCNVVPLPLLENPDGERGPSVLASRVHRRVTPREFAQWAKDLPKHFGLNTNQRGKRMQSRGFSVDFTSPLIHSRAASFASRLSLLPASAVTPNATRVGSHSPSSRASVDGGESQGGSQEYSPAASDVAGRDSPRSTLAPRPGHGQTASFSPSVHPANGRTSRPLTAAALGRRGVTATRTSMATATSASPTSCSADGYLSPKRERTGVRAGGGGSPGGLGLTPFPSPSPSPTPSSTSATALNRLDTLGMRSTGGGEASRAASGGASASGSGRGGGVEAGAVQGMGGVGSGVGNSKSRGGASRSSFTVSEVLARMLEREVRV